MGESYDSLSIIFHPSAGPFIAHVVPPLARLCLRAAGIKWRSNICNNGRKLFLYRYNLCDVKTSETTMRRPILQFFAASNGAALDSAA